LSQRPKARKEVKDQIPTPSLAAKGYTNFIRTTTSGCELLADQIASIPTKRRSNSAKPILLEITGYPLLEEDARFTPFQSERLYVHHPSLSRLE